MNLKKVLPIVCLALILLLTSTGTGHAQDEQPPRPPELPFEPPFPPGRFPPGMDQFGGGGELQAQSDLSAQALTLGAAGLNFSYAQTFGIKQAPYFSDTSHLNYPRGLTTDGNNVWIADTRGVRALKYDGVGTFVKQIGKTGFRYGTGQSLEAVMDVAVDSAGNIWMVDRDVSHILKFDSSGNYLSKLGQSYNSGTGNDQFDGPNSIAFDSAGNIYVSDGWNNRIQIFGSDGAYKATIGGSEGSGDFQFCNPQHITIASTSNYLYVADYCNHRVQIFDVTNPLSIGTPTTLGESGVLGNDVAHFNHPAGVAVDSTHIYVADEYNHRVQVFNRSNLSETPATIGEGWGQGDTNLRHPTDVAVDSAGKVYVADYLNARVQQFDSNNNFKHLRTYGTAEIPYLTDDYHYNRPSGMAVAPDGSMYITEEDGQRLIKLNAAGVFQWKVGLAGIAVDTENNAQFLSPTDVALAPSGLVYVTDASNNRIQIFNSNGTYYGTLGTGYGTGNYEFSYPHGLYITPTGTIYVADYNNQRVQIYNSSRVYAGTLGVTGVRGTDNAHFSSPNDVVVDGNGNIYVSENSNYRVQVFNSSRSYIRTIGTTGVGGDGFENLNGPNHMAVDASNNLYVSSSWDHAVHVFDKNGAYRTTVGGNCCSGNGQLANPHGLALDSAGNLYIADFDNARIQKYTIGTPNWSQVNLNGFGLRLKDSTSLNSFNNQLYAGTSGGGGGGAQVWRSSDGKNWLQVIADGFGDSNNKGIDHLIEFKGKFYAGTWNQTDSNGSTNGGQVWRSEDGTTWTKVVDAGFGDVTNGEVFRFSIFNDQIYASTWRWSDTNGVQVWRSDTGDSGDWEKVVDGAGGAKNGTITTMETFNGYLYAGTFAWNNTTRRATSCEIWRTDTGNENDWEKIVTDGFGNTNCFTASALKVFGDSLYAGTGIWDGAAQTTTGGQLWKCTAASGCDEATDWTQVINDGFGNSDNETITSLRILGNRLYGTTTNYVTGMEVWWTDNGTDWHLVKSGGFGDSNNNSFYDISFNIFNNRLFIGTANWANGGEIWRSDFNPPAEFGKSSPANNVVSQPVNLTLKWSPSADAAYYEYCLDSVTVGNHICDTDWINNGLSTSKALRSLSYGVQYEWHVRAVNDTGLTYSNGNNSAAFRTFTTAGVENLTAYSIPGYDGWTLESSEFSNIANTKSNVGMLRAGDDAKKKQYRSLLYFDTASLPNDAVISEVTLQITKPTGSNYPLTLGDLVADMKKGFFGIAALETGDFGKAGDPLSAPLKFTPNGDIYTTVISPINFKYVNLIGATQFRVRFTKDDDNDTTADVFSFYEGKDGDANSPQLIIKYTLP